MISSEFLWLSCFHIASGCEQFSFFLTALIFRQIEERVDLLEHYFIKRREGKTPFDLGSNAIIYTLQILTHVLCVILLKSSHAERRLQSLGKRN